MAWRISIITPSLLSINVHHSAAVIMPLKKVPKNSTFSYFGMHSFHSSLSSSSLRLSSSPCTSLSSSKPMIPGDDGLNCGPTPPGLQQKKNCQFNAQCGQSFNRRRGRGSHFLIPWTSRNKSLVPLARWLPWCGPPSWWCPWHGGFANPVPLV